MKKKRILALDYGEKKIGLAFKAFDQIQPDPIGNFKNQGDVISKVVNLAKEKQIETLVIGLPLSPNEKKTSMAVKVEKFTEQLRASLSQKIAIELVNETWSTKEAIERLRSLGKNASFIEKNKDSYSAVLILERYLGIS